MPSGRATILEHMTGLHGHALHWMWQRLQLSQILCLEHMEHDRLTDTCTGCGDVFNTKDDILHHACTHHVSCFFYMFLVWLMPSGRATILEPMTAAHVHALHWMWQCLILSHILRRTPVEHDRLTDACTCSKSTEVQNDKKYK